MEKLFGYVFEDHLKASPSDHPILITESPLNPTKKREKLCELMFEKFNVSSLMIVNEALLPLFGAGMVSGVVVDCGHDITSTVPVLDGNVISNAVNQLYLGGEDINRYVLFYTTFNYLFIGKN